MFKPGRAVHPTNGTGTAPDAALTPAGVKVTFDEGPNRGSKHSTISVYITNLEAAQTLEVSFADGGDGRWFSIAPATTVSLSISAFYLHLRGASGATAGYSVLGVI